MVMQELSIQQQPPVSNLAGTQEPVILNVAAGNSSLLPEENLVEKTLLSIQEKVSYCVSFMVVSEYHCFLQVVPC